MIYSQYLFLHIEMFEVRVYGPRGTTRADFLQSLRLFTRFEYKHRLSKYGTMKICIPCKSLKSKEVSMKKNRIEVYCRGRNEGTKVFDGYVHDVCRSPDEACFELIDCLGRLKRVLLENEANTNQFVYTNVTAQQVIQDVYAYLDPLYNLSADNILTLGNISANVVLDSVDYQPGKSFYDILTDLAERTGAEFRACDCELDFVIPDANNPNGSGDLLEGTYVYNYKDRLHRSIVDYQICDTMKGRGNIKVSRDTGNNKLVCATPDNASITECGRWGIFDNSPDGHDFSVNTDGSEQPTITVDGSCDDWCSIKIGDRKKAIIIEKFDEEFSFDAIYLGISIKCTPKGGIDVKYDMGSTNSIENRVETLLDKFDTLENRLSTMEQHS